MKSLPKIMPIEADVGRKAALKDRLITIGYLTMIAVAMLGWLSAFGWVTVAVAKWLVA